MQVIPCDIVVVGGGGSGLRAAIEIAEVDPKLTVASVSKVVPMRSHTVAAEGGAAGVIRGDDSLDNHFNDTVSGGDWLCDQDAVQFSLSIASRNWCNSSTGAAPGAARTTVPSTSASSAA